MSVYEFGQKLLDTNDLDPVYVVVWGAGLDDHELRRWLLAYWCFYHVGTASWIAEAREGTGGEYWDRMETAAGSASYPRSAERRHFRAANATKSVAYLRSRGIQWLFNDIETAGPNAEEVMAVVQKWVGFGPWISFKVADMVERLNIRPVEFDVATAMYEGSPTEGAKLLWDLEGQPHAGAGSGAGEWAVNRILSVLGKSEIGLPVGAPPRYERGLNVQEAETILCKWHSYVKGHYHVGEDIAAVRKGLLRFARCRLTQKLFKAGRDYGLWK